MTEFNVENYSMDELEKIRFSIEDEITKRKCVEQRKLWDEVVKAINNYCDKYKIIDTWLECDSTINNDRDFDTIGIIKS